MARYGGSQCQRNFKYLRYLRGVRDTYIRVPSSTTRDSIRHKMEKSGNFLPECKKEREKILRKSNIVGPSFFLSHFPVFHPFFVFSFFPAFLDSLSLSFSRLSIIFCSPFFSCLVSIPLSTFCPFFLSIWSWNSGTLPVRTSLARSRENFEFTPWISCWSFICSGCTCRNWLASKLSRIQPSKKFLDPRDKSS